MDLTKMKIGDSLVIAADGKWINVWNDHAANKDEIQNLKDWISDLGHHGLKARLGYSPYAGQKSVEVLIKDKKELKNLEKALKQMFKDYGIDSYKHVADHIYKDNVNKF